MAEKKIENIKFSFKKNMFKDIVDKIKDITIISDDIHFEIDKDYIYFYSISNNDNKTTAFRNYILKTDDYMSFNVFSFNISFIISNAKNLVRSLSFFDDGTIMTLSYRLLDDMSNMADGNKISFKNKKLTINWISGISIIKKIPRDKLDIMINTSNDICKFDIKADDINAVKKLVSINSKYANITMMLSNAKIIFSQENAWELDVGTIDNSVNKIILLDKNVLKYINNIDGDITFNIHDNFLLIKNDVSNLMLSYQQNFDD